MTIAFAAAAQVGTVSGNHTFMARFRGGSIVAEDFTSLTGNLVIIAADGAQQVFPKSHEPGAAFTQNPYRGHSLDEVLNSDHDLLGRELLALGDDPTYESVAACLPPIDRMFTYSFVGTQEISDKVAFAYGGRTPTFDPAIYVPAIHGIRDRKEVGDGLVGGWLPVLRFVYPEGDDWTEMLAFAPRRMLEDNVWVQPVWYRVARIEAGKLKWVRYIDSYVPFPPRGEEGPERFYDDLVDLEAKWSADLIGSMVVDLPDPMLADMAKHSLVRAMMTRCGDSPKYGVVDRNYGGSEHDGFPDTFNTDVLAASDWGLTALAGRYIDNYFARFVLDNGAILYRGPETGQFGRMLTVVAQFVEQGGDPAIVLRHRARIDAVADVLLTLRRTAQGLPMDDPAHGLLAAWSEADSCLDPDPPRYMRPYFGNSTEAARGFRDLGRVWARLGLTKRAGQLTAEADALEADIQRAIVRSLLPGDPPCLPSIAGVKEPPHVVVKADKLDPQFRGYRSFMEMLMAGNLTAEQVRTVVDYRAAQRDTILGLPTAYGYNTHEPAGFLTYGHAYGLLQHGLVPEFLLTLYSLMAHQYTRGTWTAPETRSLNPGVNAAPYCVPAQLTVPMLLRWMLAFEDPRSETLWLLKGAPRHWFTPGKTIAVTGAPTRWGKVGFRASIDEDWRIEITLDVPSEFTAALKLSLRLPDGRRLATSTSGTIGAEGETLELSSSSKRVTLTTAL
ncbi:MAG: hypothetical protein ABL879_05380 [Devosia sp.]